jgi:3-hydroxyphenylacetate 6-hydroxylase
VVSSTAGFTIGTSPASESLKRRRKAAASALNRPSVQSYVPFLHLETADFIRDLYDRGGRGAKAVDCMPMIQRLSLNLSLTLNWGDRIGSLDDNLFDEITECEEYISRFRSTTGNLQDYIPILRYSPVNKTSAKAAEYRARRDVYLRKLNSDLQDRINNGTDRPCIQGNVLKDPEAKLSEEELISISLTMLSGGLDTITTTLAWAVALLSQRPDIQETAWREIKHVYGDNISRYPLPRSRPDI